MLKLGSHVSMSSPEYILGSVKEALAYRANALMLYTGAPQNSFRAPISQLRIEEGIELWQESGNDVNDIIIPKDISPETTEYAAINDTIISVILVKKVDPDYMARCGGAFNAVATASLPVGTFFVTLATIKFNSDSILLFTGVLAIIIFGGISILKKANIGKEKTIDAEQSIREHQNKQEGDASYPGAAG